MKKIMSICICAMFFFAGCAKKSKQEKSVDQKNVQQAQSYKVIKDHRAPGVHAKVQRAKKEQTKKIHNKIQHISKAREEYYKKHKKPGVKIKHSKKK